MTVLLTRSRRVPPPGAYDFWCALPGSETTLDPSRRYAEFAQLLEQAYDAIEGVWCELGKKLGGDPSANFAHAPACAGNISDLGLMLAWARLVENWTRDATKILVVCDDPWMFRHFVMAGATPLCRPPWLFPAKARLGLRGVASRARFALGAGYARWRLRRRNQSIDVGRPALLVYGHPSSREDGTDGYFGDLMSRIPQLIRVLHIDCAMPVARQLCRDDRTTSLHAWGDVTRIFGLVFTRWRPATQWRAGAYGFLVDRAAAIEGGTGQAAAIKWQQLCQQNWLRAFRPKAIAWPWENHSWERNLVRLCRRLEIRSVGYQHTTVGRREWNYSFRSNADGTASIPDRILCSGPAGTKRLRELDYPPERLSMAGALRPNSLLKLRYDPQGPVLVALPLLQAIASEMFDCLAQIEPDGRHFLIKYHPMAAFRFQETAGIDVWRDDDTERPGFRAVIYAATTLGLEAVLAGIPGVRFQPQGTVPIDVVPDDIFVYTASAENMVRVLAGLAPPEPISTDDVFSQPIMNIWQDQLAPGGML